MQHCSALPFIVESIIITVSRWGLGDVYYEFFIFSIITEKKQNKKMSVHFVFLEVFFLGGCFYFVCFFLFFSFWVFFLLFAGRCSPISASFSLFVLLSTASPLLFG